MQLACATGLCNWPLQLACATGLCNWPVQLACATGLCNWPVELACATGKFDFKKVCSLRIRKMNKVSRRAATMTDFASCTLKIYVEIFHHP